VVYLNIDFYKLKEELLKEIVRRIGAKEIGIEYTWLLYALSSNGRENNPIFEEKLREVDKQILSGVLGKQDRDLAPICLGLLLSKDESVKEKAESMTLAIIERSINKVDFKFNVLNDSEQVFFLSLNKDKLPPEESYKLREIIRKKINGPLVRKILFSAALRNLDGDFESENLLAEFKQAKLVEEIVLSLWFTKRYTNENTHDLWKSFENIYPQIEIIESEGGQSLSSRDLALLYQAIVEEVREPNPDMLFDIYPFSADISEISKKHFKDKEYVSAVFEATKKLNEKIQELTGIKNKSEFELVQATMAMGQKGDPIIRFNEFLCERSGRSEQNGLALIAEGIFLAFRNPKGHEPKDDPLVKIEPYEALAQLIIIDYIWKRIKKATIKKISNRDDEHA